MKQYMFIKLILALVAIPHITTLTMMGRHGKSTVNYHRRAYVATHPHQNYTAAILLEISHTKKTVDGVITKYKKLKLNNHTFLPDDIHNDGLNLFFDENPNIVKQVDELASRSYKKYPLATHRRAYDAYIKMQDNDSKLANNQILTSHCLEVINNQRYDDCMKPIDPIIKRIYKEQNKLHEQLKYWNKLEAQLNEYKKTLLKLKKKSDSTLDCRDNRIVNPKPNNRPPTPDDLKKLRLEENNQQTDTDDEPDQLDWFINEVGESENTTYTWDHEIRYL
jgi:hypothetical protein